MAKLLLRVLDMHCSNCAMTIEGLEDDLPGVTSVRASYHKGTVEVEYDERRLNEAGIRDAIARLGYTTGNG